jgi:AcrR family transcriptional regulator
VIEPPADLRSSTVNPPAPLPPGRHGRTRPEVARNQRERILHATLQAVYQYTYPATTVQDIVAYAGVSRRAFYRHFRDREHAATEANELFFEHVLATCAAAYFAASGWPRRIWAAGRTLTSFFAANPAVARSGFVEFHAVSPAAIQHVYDRVWAFTLFLEEGYSCREQNRELPRLCSEALAAVMFEFAYRAARRHPAAAELPTMLPVFAYVCVAPFLGPDAATDFVQTMTKGAAIRQRGSRR